VTVFAEIMVLGKVSKIYIGWGVIMATGLAGFIYARDQVISNRKEVMKSRQRVRDAREEDQRLLAEKLKKQKMS
jgi:hypothetical protein